MWLGCCRDILSHFFCEIAAKSKDFSRSEGRHHMFVGMGSILDGLVQALYRIVSDLAYAM